MPIPNTCPDFVAHPHRVINSRGESGYCYQCQCSASSEEQGTSAIAEALHSMGIPADVEQTGGFTMCVHIPLGDKYLYSSGECFAVYDVETGGDIIAEKYFSENQTAEEKAREITSTLEKMNLLEPVKGI